MTKEVKIAEDEAERRIHNLVEDYLRILVSGKEDSFNRKRVKVAFVEPLLEALGWDDQASGIGMIEWGSDFIFTCGMNKIFIRIHGLDENLEGCNRHGRSYVEQAFQRAFDIRADWLVFTNFVETRLYDCHERKPTFASVKKIQPLRKIKFSEYELKFDDLWLISTESVFSGTLDAYACTPYIPATKGDQISLDDEVPVCSDKHEWIDICSGPLHIDGHIIRYFRCTRCGLILKKEYDSYPP